MRRRDECTPIPSKSREESRYLSISICSVAGYDCQALRREDLFKLKRCDFKESEGMKVCSTSWVSLGKIRDGCIEEAFSRSINESC